MTTSKRLLFPLAALFLISGWVHAAGFQVKKNIPYLGSERKERMDAYLPADIFQRPVPAILLIHGGGWRRGDKADGRERSFAQFLTNHGYAVFSINYLLNEGSRDKSGNVEVKKLAWPQNLYDCKSALRYIRKEADHFGVDPERIAVMGGSAGAILSTLVAATANADSINQGGLYTGQSNAVSCVVYFYGDYDTRGRNSSPFYGYSPKASKTDEAEASPITYFDDNLPPFFITHGTKDSRLPVERSRKLVKELKQRGIDYVYIEVKGGEHSYDLNPPSQDLRPELLAFLQKYLGEPVKSKE